MCGTSGLTLMIYQCSGLNQAHRGSLSDGSKTPSSHREEGQDHLYLSIHLFTVLFFLSHFFDLYVSFFASLFSPSGLTVAVTDGQIFFFVLSPQPCVHLDLHFTSFSLQCFLVLTQIVPRSLNIA